MKRSSPPDLITAPAASVDRWAEWDHFVAAHPHGGFMQSAAWIRCRAEDGYDHFVLMFRDEEKRLAGGAVVGRWEYGDKHAFYYIQEGPLLPAEPELSEAVMKALQARLEQHRHDDTAVVSHLRIEPRRMDWPSSAATAGFTPPTHDDRFREPRHTHCVDLSATEPERLQAMKPKGRYNVGLARRAGVTVVQDNTERGLDDFMTIRDETARRQGLTRRSRGHFAKMLSEFGPAAKIFFAALDGRRLACAFILRFGGRATYFYGGSLTDKREVMAPTLLHHEIMNHLAEEGCSTYDFWGTAPPGQPDHAWAGISAFKRKFGGTEVAHVPTLDYIYDRAAYAHFVDTESSTPERIPDDMPARGLPDLKVWGDCLPEMVQRQLKISFSLDRFKRWRSAGLPFYRTTFWYPLDRAASHIVEQVIQVLREAAQPSPQVVGVEWWFSVMNINATPQWLLPCHFDRADLDETDPARIRHPESASVYFVNTVPYGELVITDQVLAEDGRPSPREPGEMRFVLPGENRYAVFPGHLHHGVIGRMWRGQESEQLRVSLAINWWAERPTASYLNDSIEAVQIFDLEAVPPKVP